MKKNHFQIEERETTITETLTVFIGIETLRWWIRRGEEEEARIDWNTGCDQRDELQRIEFARRIGLLHFSEDNKVEDQYEYYEPLNTSPSGSKEDSDEDHGHFTKHHYAFPVVGSLLVAFK